MIPTLVLVGMVVSSAGTVKQAWRRRETSRIGNGLPLVAGSSLLCLGSMSSISRPGHPTDTAPSDIGMNLDDEPIGAELRHCVSMQPRRGGHLTERSTSSNRDLNFSFEVQVVSGEEGRLLRFEQAHAIKIFLTWLREHRQGSGGGSRP